MVQCANLLGRWCRVCFYISCGLSPAGWPLGGRGGGADKEQDEGQGGSGAWLCLLYGC